MGEIINSIIDNTCESLELETTVIRPYCFYNKTALKNFTDTNTLEVGESAFEGSGVTKIDFPNLESSGKAAFKDCTSLQEAYFPKLTSLPEDFLNGSINLRQGKFNIRNVTTFGKNCLHLEHRYDTDPTVEVTNIILNRENFTDGTRAVFYEGAISGEVVPNFGNVNFIESISVSDARYLGLTPGDPRRGTEPQEFVELIIYSVNSITTETTYHNKGDVVIVQSTGQPFIYRGNGEWEEYIPEFSADFLGANIFFNSGVIDVGFKVHSSVRDAFARSSILFLFVTKDVTSFHINSARNLKYLRFEQQDGTYSNVCPFTVIEREAFNDTSIADLSFPNVETIQRDAFTNNRAINQLSFPSLSRIEGYTGTGYGTIFRDCTNLEKLFLGDGTKILTLVDSGVFRDASTLWYLELNYTSVPAFTGGGDNNWANTLKNNFDRTPIYWYKGSTTTPITVGSAISEVNLYGKSYTPTTNEIITYDGKQYQVVSNKWVEWGVDGNRKPRVKVPENLIQSYLGDKFSDTLYPNYTKWGDLNPEVYFDSTWNYVVSVEDAESPSEGASYIPLWRNGNTSPKTWVIRLEILSFSGIDSFKVLHYQDDNLIETLTITEPGIVVENVISPYGVDDRYDIVWEGTLTLEYLQFCGRLGSGDN